MADFDAIVKEVKNLEEKHTSLLVLIPQLEEEEKGLKESISAGQRELAQIEEEQEELRSSMDRIQETFNKQVIVERSAIEVERKVFEDYKAKESAKIDSQIKLMKEAQAKLDEDRSELDTLLQKQVEINQQLEEGLADYKNKLEALDAERALFDGQKKLFDVDVKDLEKRKAALANEEASVASDRQKATDILKDAEAKQSKANKAMAEAKEHKNLVLLKIDEYQRKEALLKEQAMKLRKREIAISDKEAVYSSYK